MSSQDEYQWETAADAEILTVERDQAIDQVPPHAWREKIDRAFETLQPAVCAVAGYSHPSMRAGIQWCAKRRRPVILMSDSTAWDAPRRPWKEWIKKRIVANCSAGFVAGQPHADYLQSLGMPRRAMSLGYDVVDNDHIRAGAAAARANEATHRESLQLPEKYFLAVARFVEKKNLPCLLRAFAIYRRQQRQQNAEAWDLVLVGEGPLREQLASLCNELHIAEHVHFTGHQPYNILPHVYGLAEALVHPSTVEQWGLVVNEAMAASLPVLVSRRCGCASSLVKENENGWLFDPESETAIADRLVRMTNASPHEREQMASRSAEIVADFSLPRFAAGLEQAIEAALSSGPPHRRPLSSLALHALRYLPT
jgi:glycosyltransferase involved in cell wall biosynthesis